MIFTREIKIQIGALATTQNYDYTPTAKAFSGLSYKRFLRTGLVKELSGSGQPK